MTDKKPVSVFDKIFSDAVVVREYTSAGWEEGTRASIYGVTVDTEKPITGVIANNDIVQFLGDGFCDAIDLGWEEAIEEFQAEHGREPDDVETDEMASMMDGYSGPSLIGDWTIYERRADGQGLATKDGDLTVSGMFDFHGLIMVSGDVKVTGDARKR